VVLAAAREEIMNQFNFPQFDRDKQGTIPSMIPIVRKVAENMIVCMVLLHPLFGCSFHEVLRFIVPVPDC